MDMKRLLILILMLNGFGAAYAQDASDEEQIKETLTAMWAAIEGGDVDLYATYVHPGSPILRRSDSSNRPPLHRSIPQSRNRIWYKIGKTGATVVSYEWIMVNG